MGKSRIVHTLISQMSPEDRAKRNEQYEKAKAQRKIVGEKIEFFVGHYKEGTLTTQEMLTRIHQLFVQDDFVDFAFKNPV
jgi:hypothetical protein